MAKNDKPDKPARSMGKAPKERSIDEMLEKADRQEMKVELSDILDGALAVWWAGRKTIEAQDNSDLDALDDLIPQYVVALKQLLIIMTKAFIGLPPWADDEQLRLHLGTRVLALLGGLDLE